MSATPGTEYLIFYDPVLINTQPKNKKKASFMQEAFAIFRLMFCSQVPITNSR